MGCDRADGREHRGKRQKRRVVGLAPPQEDEGAEELGCQSLHVMARAAGRSRGVCGRAPPGGGAGRLLRNAFDFSAQLEMTFSCQCVEQSVVLEGSSVMAAASQGLWFRNGLGYRGKGRSHRVAVASSEGETSGRA